MDYLTDALKKFNLRINSKIIELLIAENNEMR